MLGKIRQALSGLMLLGLFVVLLSGVGPSLSAQLVSIGEYFWPQYAQDLRYDAVEPDCDLHALEARQSACVDQPSVSSEAKDPFADEAEEDPFADDVEEDPFAEDSHQEDPFAEEAEEDPFADDVEEDPFAEPSKDPVQKTIATGGNCAALQTLTERCAVRHSDYQMVLARITPSVKVYRSVEKAFGEMAKFPYWKQMLIFLTLAGACCVTLLREHIALRHVETLLEHRVSQGLQMIVHLAWMVSCWMDYQIQVNSSATPEHLGIPLLWTGGFALLSLINLGYLIKTPIFSKEKSRFTHILMTIPLFTYMGLISTVWFFLIEGHFSGQAIYLHKFIQIPNIYLGIGLYIWAGMLFATTRVARLAFALLTPWGFPIGVLAWLAVVLSALPTAYSGASGIFVIAAGAVIFEQLREAGASKRLALAATAMSGSLGVVLRPCLVVVLVAVLNKQVTTDELFGYGLWVFLLTSVLLLLAFLWRSKEPLKIQPKANAKQEFVHTLKELLPYGIVAVTVIGVYAFLLNMQMNEQNAAYILPMALLMLVVLERRKIRPNKPEESDQRLLLKTLMDATLESSTHIGALLILMAASVALGGVVEKAEVMDLFPSELGGPIGAMTALVLMMVLVGMTMDALGAVVLVSITLAKVAYSSGIHPVHFWMMVLVAFELGYLTPPVALNHLLAKQVIGEEAILEQDQDNWWDQNEHLWLPMLVMGTALILVAYIPFLWYL